MLDSTLSFEKLIYALSQNSPYCTFVFYFLSSIPRTKKYCYSHPHLYHLSCSLLQLSSFWVYPTSPSMNSNWSKSLLLTLSLKIVYQTNDSSNNFTGSLSDTTLTLRLSSLLELSFWTGLSHIFPLYLSFKIHRNVVFVWFYLLF